MLIITVSFWIVPKLKSVQILLSDQIADFIRQFIRLMQKIEFQVLNLQNLLQLVKVFGLAVMLLYSPGLQSVIGL